ncbi:MAG: hypothetical protein JNK82_08550, partial [Myxococcaceae bacterium]|nr:hypothetical protein [Myxococcaceae bacterium]
GVVAGAVVAAFGFGGGGGDGGGAGGGGLGRVRLEGHVECVIGATTISAVETRVCP